MKIVSLNIATPAPHVYDGREVLTAGYRLPVASALLTLSGFEGDGVGDPVNHGGADKAVNVYPHDHYAYWSGVFGAPLPVAAFSENLTLAGALETGVCLGDQYVVGEALVEVSQPRVPCFKLNLKHDKPRLVQWIISSGFTGFYLRVLRPGLVRQGDTLTRALAHPAEISIADLNALYYARETDHDGLRRALDVPALSAAWRQTFSERLA
jgi:MOSC domain-containing protein YiiM